MDDPGQAIVEALDSLAELADEFPAERAVEELDTATLQAFFREWPAVSSWAGSLWRLLSADVGRAPAAAPDLEEIGGEG